MNVLDLSKPKEKNNQTPIVTSAVNKAIIHSIEIAPNGISYYLDILVYSVSLTT